MQVAGRVQLNAVLDWFPRRKPHTVQLLSLGWQKAESGIRVSKEIFE
jgi:hypothetical protein